MASWWRPGTGVWVFGVLALAMALVAYLLLEEPFDAAAAFALGLSGLFALLVLTERSVPAPSASAALEGSAAAIHEAATGLSLDGNASTVPKGPSLARDRLFLAAARSEKPLPALDDATILYGGPASVRIGIAIEPPGRLLVERWEEASGRAFASTPIANLQASLAGLGVSEGLFHDARVREEKGRFHVSFTPADVSPPCMRTRPGDRLPCERTACALCSAACVALARALQRPVTLEEARVAAGRVDLTLSPEGPA